VFFLVRVKTRMMISADPSSGDVDLHTAEWQQAVADEFTRGRARANLHKLESGSVSWLMMVHTRIRTGDRHAARRFRRYVPIEAAY
jgi:hypothetical protein